MLNPSRFTNCPSENHNKSNRRRVFGMTIFNSSKWLNKMSMVNLYVRLADFAIPIYYKYKVEVD